MSSKDNDEECVMHSDSVNKEFMRMQMKLSNTLLVKKKQQKVTTFLVVPNIFPRLKLTPTKKFYPLFFLLNKNQITEILKKL